MKKFVLPLIALFVLASPLLAQKSDADAAAAGPAGTVQAGAEQDPVIEEIVARVNNSIITRAELRRNREQTAQDAKEQNLTPSQMEERQGNALRDLIDQQLLVQKAAELGITADAELVKRLDDLRKQMKVGSLEELQKLAEGQGVSWEEFKQNIKTGILTQKVIGSEVGSHIQLTREELQKYYDEHKADFTQPERVRLSEILIANDPKAQKNSPVAASPELVAAAQSKVDEVYKQLKAGAQFDELARKESNGSTAEQGGDLGYFKRNDLAKELENQTFALKAGEFTPPVRTRQGFIILLVSDHIEAGTPPFDRVREQIQDQIYTKRVQPALRAYLTKLRDAAYIDVKAGYSDSGASPNQSHLVWAADSGPRTKEVRSKLGMGKKKTVVVTGNDKKEHVERSGSSSELGSAKNPQKQKAAEESEAPNKAEQEKLSHMSRKQRSKYLAEKKRETRQEPAGNVAAAPEKAPSSSGSSKQQAHARRETKAQEKARWKEEDRKDKLAQKEAKRKGAKAGTTDQKSTETAKAPDTEPASTQSASAPAASTPADATQAPASTLQPEPSQQAASAPQADSTPQVETKQPDASTQQADTKPPEKKKKFSWF